MLRCPTKTGTASLKQSGSYTSFWPGLGFTGNNGRLSRPGYHTSSARIGPSASGNGLENRLMIIPVAEEKLKLGPRVAKVIPTVVWAEAATNDPLLGSLEIPPTSSASDEHEVVEAIFKLTANGEASLDSLGMPLTFWPSSWVQHSLEWVHCDLGLPWWSTIVATSILVRFALFPLLIKSQIRSAKTYNSRSKLEALTVKINETEAKRSRDQDVCQYKHEYLYLKRNRVPSLLFSARTMAIGMSIYVPVFFGLEWMANLPIESMKTGGLAWFTDLTVADPTYILPTVAAGTLYLTLKSVTDAASRPVRGRETKRHLKYLKCGSIIVPVVVYSCLANFPAAMLWYLVTLHTVTLGQIMFLRYEPVRQYFEIPRRIKPDDLLLQKQQKENDFENLKIQEQIQERANYDAADFATAASVPVVKTYKYDPTTANKNQLKKKE